jgi:DNA-3-methyladenine glycosylase I
MSGASHNARMTEIAGAEAPPVHRCGWADSPDQLLVAYHDAEWGVPIRDERHLFELLCLEGAQAGLSWNTILRKRDGYRAAFAGFNPATVAAFDGGDIERLMADPGIVRNRAKILAAIQNANATLALQEAGTTLVDHLWSFVGGTTKANPIVTMGEIPSETDESRAMSKDLRARGFTFVGPTICYALMQSAGLVNDHQLDCFRRNEV